MEIDKQIEKAKNLDQSAFTFLLNSYWSEVYGFVLKRTENEAIAEDITIETFSKAFSKITTYNPDFQFNTWLIAIAKNVHIDLIRRNKSEIFVEFSNFENKQIYNFPDPSSVVEDKLISEQNILLLVELLKTLKPYYQEVIQLRYFQGMSYQEIADYIGEPLSNVKVKLLRAKKILTETIEKNKFGK